MDQYHKIDSLYKRDTNGKMMFGSYSRPEFEYLKSCDWEFTEKVDGTNIRVIYKDDELEFGGKTDNAQIPVSLVNKLNELFSVEQFRELFPPDEMCYYPDVCLYGEGYGAKIQKGGGNYIPDGVDFVLFDVKIGDWWLERSNVEEIANALNIGIVPIVLEGPLGLMENLCKAGFKSQWGDFTAEGLVARPKVGLKTRGGHRIITKLKHKDFQ